MNNHPPHCITLIGMMGSGKTLVGRYLALRLGWTFIDLDERIVKDAGRSIADIFAADGESAFRALELRTLTEVLTSSDSRTVLSLGGGTILQSDCARLVKEHSLCIRLTASASTLYERLKADRKRPLLHGAEPLEDKIKRLLSEREPAYAAAADVSIPTDGRSVDSIIDDILFKFV